MIVSLMKSPMLIVVCLTGLIFSSCLAKGITTTTPAVGGSKLSSITMPIPPALKTSVSPDKINAYSLDIKGGDCDPSGKGTDIGKPFNKLASDDTLANEKIRRACAYTVVLTLGKSDAAGLKMEKIYLTNDIEGQRTQISKDDSRSEKIRMVINLTVTDDGKKDLGLDQSIPVPSSGEVDAIIEATISKNDGTTTQPPAGDYDWRKESVLADVQKQDFSGNFHGSAYYKDIMEHTHRNARLLGDGWSTEAHETCHGLVNAMRNLTPADDAFVYLEGGKGLYVIRPKKVLRQLNAYVSPSFQNETTRFDLYFNKSTDWQDPLYLFDEWNAYVATTRSATEMVKANQWDGENADPLEGLADFVYFGAVVVTGLQELDPDYMKSNKQFKAAFALLAEESIKASDEAIKLGKWPNSKWARRIEMFRKGPENEKVRSSVRTFMGASWTKRVLGF